MRELGLTLGTGAMDRALVELLAQPHWRRRDVVRVIGLLGLEALSEGRPVGSGIESCARSLAAELELLDDPDPEEVQSALEYHFEQDPIQPALFTAIAELKRRLELERQPLAPRASTAREATLRAAAGNLPATGCSL